MQAATQGRSWLFIGLAGLLMCAVGAWLPAGRAQGRWLLAGGAIGARGWSFVALNTQFGELAINQFGIGAGGFVALTALVLLAAFGIARLGLFKGDLFVAAAVIGCGVLMALFIAYPVSKALSGALFNEDGQWSITAFIARVFTERIWGLGCLAGGVRCGVAWNTLVLALLAAAGTTFLGTLMALMAERGSKRGQGMLRVLALLPIITPPFVVGLGLILLFGRAGIVNQLLENVFGIEPTRWFYGMPGGPAPHLLHRHAAALEARVGQRLPGRFHRKHCGLWQPRGGGRAVLGALDRHLLRHRRRAVRPRPRGLAGLGADAVRTRRVRGAARCAGQTELHDRERQGRRRHRDGIARRRAPHDPLHRAAVDRIHGSGLPFRVRRRLRADLGPRLQLHAQPLQECVRIGVGPVRPGLGRHGMELADHHAQARRHLGAHHRGAGPADRVAAGAQRVQGAGHFRVRCTAGVCHSGHRARRELYPGLQRAAAGAHGHRAHHRAVLHVPEPAGGRAGRHGGLQAARPLARRSLADTAGLHLADAVQSGAAAAAQARTGGRAGLQLRARDDDGERGDLPGHRRERAGHHLHHRPRRQRRLRHCAGVLHGAHDPDVAGDCAGAVRGRGAQAGGRGATPPHQGHHKMESLAA